MIGELAEFFEWLQAAVAGWRFLLVPSYRHEVISGWKNARWYSITWDIICGLSGLAFSVLIVFALVYIIFGS